MEANGKLLNNSVLKTEDTHPKRGHPSTSWLLSLPRATLLTFNVFVWHLCFDVAQTRERRKLVIRGARGIAHG